MSPGKLQELLDQAKHKTYFDEHQAEFPFPIDGSVWSRLVSTRISHEHHCKCDRHFVPDFWVWLHAVQGPLRHERKTFQRALHHWFLLGNEQYDLPEWSYIGEETKRELAWKAIYDCASKKSRKDLTQFEAEWLTGGVARKVWLPDSSQHWVSGGSEESESRQPLRIKRGVNAHEDEHMVSLMNDSHEDVIPIYRAEDLEAIGRTESGANVIYLPAQDKNQPCDTK